MGGAFSRNFPVAPCANIYRGVSRPVQADKLGVRATRDAAHLSISLVGARACTHSRRKMAHRGSRVNTCIKMSPVFRPSSPSSFSLPSLVFLHRKVHDRCRDKTREYLSGFGGYWEDC